ncbi:MAG: hypothetical protein R3E89_10650 [Thiolinea sp.]
MSILFRYLLSALCLLLISLPGFAAEPDPAPILRVEPGMHFAQIKRIDVGRRRAFCGQRVR